ncbi:MAG: C45 family peptidase [Cytobacillus gottheilii]|uniref:C45 family autoproteolytic acyltransferase/hydolase n=1 Tax=Cytobacillus gottheilii TaxID=859144 RepID=UPI003463CB16
MKKVLVADAVKIEGSYYEIGYKQGQYLLEKGGMLVDEYKKMTTHSNTMEAKEMIFTYFPSFAEEIKGMADALKMDESLAVSLFSGYDITFPQMGCTSYSQDGLYVRNYDFSPDLYDARLVCLQPNKGYASIGFSQQICGRLDGMNEKGLVIGLHFVNDQLFSKGFIATAIVRMVLDQCANAKEAAALIKKVPHGYCYNYSIIDKEGNSLLIEAAPEEQIVSNTSVMRAVNHFHSPSLQSKNRPNISDSCRRKEMLSELDGLELSPQELFRYFNQGNSPYFYHQYKQYFGTLHTVVYNSANLQLICGVGADSELHILSLKDCLQAKWEDWQMKGYIHI